MCALDLTSRLSTWRRHLHRHPEVGLDLPATLAYVSTELAAMGLEVRPCGGGLLVDLGPEGPRVAWRADLDALALTEDPAHPHASRVPGAMHACGHDAHTAIALGLAWVLSRQPAPPPLRLIFQPGEEGCFGARRMVEAGALDGVTALCGLHVGALDERLQPGQFALRAGAQMAAGDRFRAVFRGRGTHGAQPHLGRDPLPAAAAFVALAQTLRGREIAPGRLALVTVGTFHGGTADNVIAESVELRGIVRTEHAEDRTHLETRLGEAAQGLALAHGVQVDWTWTPGYPAVRNDPAWAARAERLVGDLFGAGALLRLEAPAPTSEDVSFFLEQVPGVYLFLGTNNPALGIVEPNHSPRFDVDEAQLERGVLLAEALIRNAR